MRFKIFIPYLLIFNMIFLSGCVEKNEIEALAIVLGVGIDKSKLPNTVKVTVQIAQAQKKESVVQTNTNSYYTVSSEGKNLFEAIRRLSKFVSSPIYWSYNQIVIISEDFAKKGLVGVVDFFTRNLQFRPTTFIAITPDKASDLLQAKTGLEIFPMNSLDKLFRNTKIYPTKSRNDFRFLLKVFSSESKHIVLPGLKIDKKLSHQEENQYQIKQINYAVFKNDKMLGWLNNTEATGYLWIAGVKTGGNYTLSIGDKNKCSVSLELLSGKTNLVTTYSNNKVEVNIHIKVNAKIVEVSTDMNRSNKEIVKLSELELKKQIISQMTKCTLKTQKQYNSDIFGFGEMLKKQHPYEWHKIREKWAKLFPVTKVNYLVRAEITSTSLLAKPISPEKKH